MAAAMSRFAEPPHVDFRALNDSIGFDWRLAPYDIEQSRAHAAMLAAQGIISGEDRDRLHRALDQAQQELSEGSFPFADGDEDIRRAGGDRPGLRRVDVGVGSAGDSTHGLTDVVEPPELSERRIVRRLVGVKADVPLGIANPRIAPKCREDPRTLSDGSGSEEGPDRREALLCRRTGTRQRSSLPAQAHTRFESNQDLRSARGALGSRRSGTSERERGE